MQTKNKIALKRNTLYRIMLLGIFLSAFGVGNLPVAHALDTKANQQKSAFENLFQSKDASIFSQAQVVQNPQWKILVLIYSSTDFSYSDGSGQHQVIASMSQSEIDRTVNVAQRFVEIDIPKLTNGYMIPVLTVRAPNRALTTLDSACGYWPNRANTLQELDPTFDSIIVVWDDSGTDINTGQPADLNGCGGLAISNGIGQTYLAIPIDSVTTSQQNVFKHEWGHSILAYFEATGATPQPSVDNHINGTTNQYINCVSGNAYILQDETNDNPITNSIYNNDSGFTHDYYSGVTAKPENPSTCLGISKSVWATGGPVTKPPMPNPVDILVNGGFEEGTTSPALWNPDAWIISRSTFTWDTTQKHSGNKSVKISNDTTNDARWIQIVNVQPNTDYRLSGWIKTENIDQTRGDRGANLSYGTFLNTPHLSGTNDWTYVYIDFNTGSKTQITVSARLGMDSGDITGTAWFDDLKLETAGSGVSTFADVPLTHPLYKYIQALYDGGYTAGCSTSPLMFCPDTILDRAQSAVFMLRGAKGSTYAPPAAPWYTFLSESWFGFEWAQGWAEGMYQEGLTQGCQTNPLKFCPANQLPRVEASIFGLKMKYGVTYLPPPATGTLFADFPSTDPSYWGIAWAEKAYVDGLLPACGTDTVSGKPMFCPGELVNRGWGAYLIVKAKGLPTP